MKPIGSCKFLGTDPDPDFFSSKRSDPHLSDLNPN